MNSMSLVATTVAVLIMMADAAVLLMTLWNVKSWPRVSPGLKGTQAGSVSVLIPARNEEHRISPCLESLLAQSVCTEILVYDDLSEDDTARVVSRWAARDRRVRLIPALPLPEGWCGKPFACTQLAGAASAQWLLFLDADAQLKPESIASMVGEARSRDASFLSCWPCLAHETFWERALMPMLSFCVFNLFPAPLSLQRQDPSLGMAHGACILAKKDVYDRLGGHQLVRDELVEDVLLARRWRQNGERAVFLDGSDLVHVRMYTSFGEIWHGFQKNFYPAFQRRGSFWGFITFHFTAFLLPFAGMAAVWRPFGALWLLWGGALCVLCSRLLLARRFRQPIWSAMLHPFAEILLIALGLSSLRRARGEGVEWKGRTYRRD